MTKKIHVITGPTASGKTALALQRAQANPEIEIVNADASLLYRGLDIGTAKPSKEILATTVHHIINILEPHERFNAADYSSLARNTIREIISNGKTPLIVGGTGFYIDALFFGITPLQADEDKLLKARERISDEIQEFGFDLMHTKLKLIDPELYEQILRERNPRRLERAWEFYYATGIPLGEARKEVPEPFEFEPVFTVLEVDREELRKRIASRIDEMLAAGWLDEVKNLLLNGITLDMPAMNAIGYKELAEVLTGEKPLEQAREEIIIRTRQYAKRQETWMKRYKQFENVH
jgi:tRNA dimethylallyltransferase